MFNSPDSIRVERFNVYSNPLEELDGPAVSALWRVIAEVKQR
jgi:hypothetical protein